VISLAFGLVCASTRLCNDPARGCVPTARSHLVMAAGGSDLDGRILNLFDSFDADGDGSLTKEEKDEADSRLMSLMTQLPPALGDALQTGGAPQDFDSIDADNSGGISREEFVEAWKQRYSSYSPALQAWLLERFTTLLK